METNSNIRKEVFVSPLTVSRVYKSDFQKEDTLTAELKQKVTTKAYYPTKSVSNSLQDNIFTMEDFGFEEKEFENTETRVAWIDVPKDSKVETVKAILAKLPNAMLYRILDNTPILADTDQHAVNNPDLDVTLDTFADKQVVRYPEGHENAGELALYNGKAQYRRIAFSKVEREDVDLRTLEPAHAYASPKIKAELNGTPHVMPEQTL